jgi:putative membrane protein
VRYLTWLLTTAAALAVATWLLDGIWFSGPTSGNDEILHKVVPLLIVSAILGVVSIFVEPFVKLLSLPFIILTLGLFLWVINALMLLLTEWIAGLFGIGFHIDGFWPALWGALIITVVNWFIDLVVLED